MCINNDNFEEDDGIGLFSAITGENTIVKGVRIQGTISSASNGSAGFISGLLADKATIDDCIVLPGSSISTFEAGGIAGRMLMSGTIKNSTNNAAVIALGSENEPAKGKAGGIVNSAYYDKFPNKSAEITDYDVFSIRNCTNNGDISGISGVAGIVGLAGSPVEIKECTNNGFIEGENYSIGGIVGELIHGASVIGCVNRGDVNNTGVANSVDTGNATGGLVGWIRYYNPATYNTSLVCSVVDSHNYGDISSKGSCIGGAIGLIYWAGDISVCSSEGTVTTGTGNMAGGFCGGVQYLADNSKPDANYSAVRNNGITFTDCHSDNASLVINGDGSVIGKFIGHDVDCEIEGYTNIVTTFTDCTPTGKGSGIKD